MVTGINDGCTAAAEARSYSSLALVLASGNRTGFGFEVRGAQQWVGATVGAREETR
jgi:hypothetical protein